MGDRVGTSLTVNGMRCSAPVDPSLTLLGHLRGTLGLTGTKEGCGRGECGACTVLLDGEPILACVIPAFLAKGDVTTIEGLGEEALPLREAFADCGGFQCGFCTSGQIVHGWSLIRRGLPADRHAAARAVRKALSGNICRCTGYDGIVAAVLRAGGLG